MKYLSVFIMFAALVAESNAANVSAFRTDGIHELNVSELARLLHIQSFGSNFELDSKVKSFEFVVICYRKGKEVCHASSGMVSGSEAAPTVKGEVRLHVLDPEAFPGTGNSKYWRVVVSVLLGAGSTASTDISKDMFDFRVLNAGLPNYRRPSNPRGMKSISDVEGKLPLIVLFSGMPAGLPDPLTPESIEHLKDNYTSDFVVGYLVVKGS